MEIEFPIEFIVLGTPVSLQSSNGKAREQWKQRVLEACQNSFNDTKFSTDRSLTVFIYYFPVDDAQGDLDNCIKLILDALVPNVISNDSQVESIIIRRFPHGSMSKFDNPSSVLTEALKTEPPAVYVAVYDNPYEGMK